MMRFLAATVLAALVAAASAAAIQDPLQYSSNWSGYAVTGASFTDATGTWKQPVARCRSGSATSSSFWVGIGGFAQDAPSLEQLGSVADCDAQGRQTYRLWWEVIPAPAQFISLQVAPGDVLNAALVVSGQNVIFSIKNQTHGTRFSKTVTVQHAVDTSSAEWIAEAPSLCTSSATSSCRVVPLTNFGSVGFTNLATVGDGHAGTITDPLWTLTPIALASTSRYTAQSNPSGAQPANVSADGRAFSVSFQSTLATANRPAGLKPGGPIPPWASGKAP